MTDPSTPPTGIKAKVLIADDDPPTRMLLRASISQWNYECVEAVDGEEAWNILQTADAPRLLLLDWLMPKLNGIDLCSLIRDNLKTSYKPYIILLTQLGGTENIVSALDAGANEFLLKPINIMELRSRLAVGEKIIRYETDLANQNETLLHYIAQVELANALIVNASQKLDASTQQTQQNTPQFQQLQELGTNLNDVIGIFKNFQPSSTRKKN
jgi:DNA-binding response OmpR family regulator